MSDFQMSLFDGTQPFIIDKPIRLIEIFGGYGSQSLALKYLGVPFEHHLLSEWAVKSIQAYKDLHFGEDATDYSEKLSKDEIVDFLDGRCRCSNISNKGGRLTRSENYGRTYYL